MHPLFSKVLGHDVALVALLSFFVLNIPTILSVQNNADGSPNLSQHDADIGRQAFLLFCVLALILYRWCRKHSVDLSKRGISFYALALFIPPAFTFFGIMSIRIESERGAFPSNADSISIPIMGLIAGTPVFVVLFLIITFFMLLIKRKLSVVKGGIRLLLHLLAVLFSLPFLLLVLLGFVTFSPVEATMALLYLFGLSGTIIPSFSSQGFLGVQASLFEDGKDADD